MNFERLVIRIQQTNDFLQQSAVKAVNTHLTFRNWLIGFHIVEFQQNGSDRAEYGTKLLENIAKKISVKGIPLIRIGILYREFHSGLAGVLK